MTDKNTEATIDEASEEVVETEAGEAPAEQGTPGLTINDLASLKNIIDVASSRGAFKTAEFNAVGDTYGRLTNFLASLRKPEDVVDETSDETEEAAEA